MQHFPPGCGEFCLALFSVLQNETSFLFSSYFFFHSFEFNGYFKELTLGQFHYMCSFHIKADIFNVAV